MLHRATHHIRQHLVPTTHNGFVPHVLREGHILGMLGIGIALFAFVQVARLTDYFGLAADVYPAVIVSLTNRDREQHSLSLLSTSPTLEAAAKLKAEDMASKGYFAHTSPEGRTPWYWFAQAGYQFIYAGENLAVNYSESDAVQSAWLNSPTHRANIMNTNFTEMGVATATGIYNGRETTFVVEMFGMPATAKPATTTDTAAAPAQAPASVPTATTTVTSPSPTTIVPAPSPATTTPSPATAPDREVAGEAAVPVLSVLEETQEFVMAQNNDATLEPAVDSSAPAPKVSWMKRLVLNSDRIAGLLIQTFIILAIIATAGMVAREYEKHHKKHMVYGTLLAVVMFAFLFVGGLGVFNTGTSPLAQAMELERSRE